MAARGVVAVRLLDDRNVTILLSILVAVGLWYYVTASQNPEIARDLDVELRLRGLPSEFVVTDVPSRVTVRLRGPRSALGVLSTDQVDAFVDLSKVRVGSQLAPVAVRVPPPSRVAEVTPAEVRVTADLVAQRQIPVEVEIAGTVPPGIALGPPTARPERATVRGPRGLVQTARRAVAVVDAAKLDRPLTETVPLEVRDASGNVVPRVQANPAAVQVSVPVRERTLTRVVPVVPLLVGSPAPGYAVGGVSVSPQTVEVTGPPGLVGPLASVTTARIPLDDARERLTRRVSLALPAGVSSRTPAVQVTIEVGPSQTERVLAGVSVQIRGLADGLEAQIAPASVTVTIRGAATVVGALRSSDLVAVADAAGLGPGRHEVRISVEAPAGAAIQAVDPQMVTVTVSRRSGGWLRAA